MNNKRRKEIRKLIFQLESDSVGVSRIKMSLEGLLREEEESMDNMPESLQETERYQIMDESCDLFRDAISELDSGEDMDKDYVVETLEKIDGV